MNQIGGWSARYIKRRRRVFTAVCILTPGKMEGLLQHVTVFLLLVSVCNFDHFWGRGAGGSSVGFMYNITRNIIQGYVMEVFFSLGSSGMP